MLYSLFILTVIGQVQANNIRPQIGYVYPPGARAGSTLEVKLGTYDWTPDMQILAHDPRVKIQITGPAGDPILTPPPYWFGNKAGQAQPPLAREVPARITIPADFPPGPVRWQAANANGGSNVNIFMVSDTAEVVEPEARSGPLELPALPVAVSGRVSRIAEVDEYQFTVADDGLVVCRLDDRLGQSFSGLLSIRDSAGNLVADKADTTETGATVRFLAKAGEKYTATVNDVEFAGDRGYVYRLTIQRGPHVLVTLPAVIARGKAQSVEIIGWGVATGELKLEAAAHTVSPPADAPGETYAFSFDTPAGRTTRPIALSDVADAREPEASDIAARKLTVPAAIAGTLDQMDAASGMPLDRYTIAAKKGDVLRIAAESARFGSTVDPSLAIIGPDGKEVARNDDLPGASDAGVDFKPAADGVYEVIVSDVSGNTPSRASIYRLTVENPAEVADFTLQAPDWFDLQVGATTDLVLKSSRRGSWDEPIEITFEGLPEGVIIVSDPPPAEPAPAAPGAKKPPRPKKPAPGDIKVKLASSADSAAAASLAYVVGKATVGDKTIERRVGPILVATTLKTRAQVKSAVKDGGRIVNRGTTYPADVIVERLEGYTGPVTLRMAAAQQRQRRGIRSEPLIVPPEVDRLQYPIFMPEWLETSLTARMILITEAQVPDAKGNIRHVTGNMDGFIVMSLEGGLLKISHEPQERVARIGGTFEIPVRVSRSVRLPMPAHVEVVPTDELGRLIAAESITLPATASSAVVKLRLAADERLVGARQVTIRATALQDGKWPAISETIVPLIVESKDPAVAAAD